MILAYLEQKFKIPALRFGAIGRKTKCWEIFEKIFKKCLKKTAKNPFFSKILNKLYVPL